MPFHVEAETTGRVPVVWFSGDLTGDAGPAVQDVYGGLPELWRTRVILDFARVRYINSSGIAVLLALITQAVKKDHRIDFCGVPTHLRSVMDLVGMTDYVGSFATREEAMGRAK